jgi:hypothetical protein
MKASKAYVRLSRGVELTRKEWSAYQLLLKQGRLRRVNGVKAKGMKKTPGDRWEPWSPEGVPRGFTRTVFINRLRRKGLAELGGCNPNEVYQTTLASTLNKE